MFQVSPRSTMHMFTIKFVECPQPSRAAEISPQTGLTQVQSEFTRRPPTSPEDRIVHPKTAEFRPPRYVKSQFHSNGFRLVVLCLNAALQMKPRTVHHASKDCALAKTFPGEPYQLDRVTSYVFRATKRLRTTYWKAHSLPSYSFKNAGDYSNSARFLL